MIANPDLGPEPQRLAGADLITPGDATCVGVGRTTEYVGAHSWPIPWMVMVVTRRRQPHHPILATQFGCN